jgi:chromosome condensin MukBEF ATPase and DNA-binding subunit MukB
MLTLLRAVPIWAWALIAILAWGGWQRHAATQAQTALRLRDAAVAAETIKAQQASMTETARRLAAQKEIADDAQARSRRAAVDAAGARSAADGLRGQLAALAASAAAGHPTAVDGRQAGVLARSLGECVGRYAEVAAVADASINSGRACERSYDSLTVSKP